MYQEAIEQSAKQLGLQDYYEPNPEMERIDAALSESNVSLAKGVSLTKGVSLAKGPGLLAIDDTPEDIKYSNYNNAITFIEPKELEHLFELYQPLEPFSRSYHPGRIYGNGEYGDPKRERDYQAFIHNTDLVLLTKLLASVSTEPIPNNLRFDDLQSE
jgi:hypothetical protein